jgi:hypothetical protein
VHAQPVQVLERARRALRRCKTSSTGTSIGKVNSGGVNGGEEAYDGWAKRSAERIDGGVLVWKVIVVLLRGLLRKLLALVALVSSSCIDGWMLVRA